MNTSTDNVNGNWTYTYDTLNRVSTGVSNVGEACQFSYDPFGNRTSEAPYQRGSCNSEPLSFSASATNQVDGNCNGHCYASGYTFYKGTPDEANAAFKAMGAQQTLFDKNIPGLGFSGDDFVFHPNSTTNRMAIHDPITLVLQVPNPQIAVPQRTQIDWRVVNTGWQHIKDAAGALMDPNSR